MLNKGLCWQGTRCSASVLPATLNTDVKGLWLPGCTMWDPLTCACRWPFFQMTCWRRSSRLWHFTLAGCRQVSPDSLAVTRVLICALRFILKLPESSGANLFILGSYRQLLRLAVPSNQPELSCMAALDCTVIQLSEVAWFPCIIALFAPLSGSMSSFAVPQAVW